MRLKFLNFLTFTLLSFFAIAQTGNVSGNVFIDTGFGDNLPLPEYPVLLVTGAGDAIEVITDADGHYAIDFDITVDVDPVGTISVFDFCNGETIAESLASNAEMVWTVDFSVCNHDIDPPVACDAYFYEEQISVDPYIVAFTDASYAEPEAIEWAWDFGDGETSEEQNPEHTYAAIGIYDVLLTISSDSCTSTVIYPVIVSDNIEDCICTDEWMPVCVAAADGDTLTFPNFCYAVCEGFTEDQIIDCDWTNPCDCTDEWAPVCVEIEEGLIITFPNACWAECEGFTEEDFVDCEPNDCDCTDEWAPVCVDLGDGVIIDYSNACWAECEGFTEEDFVDCEIDDCNCTDEWDPVCVATDEGFAIQFPNACWAECSGYGEEDFIDCGITACDCTDEWDPVCVEIEEGLIITFPNACWAECEGFDEEDFVECEGDCNCTDEWAPVCVEEFGWIRTFPNACWAACEGFGEEDFVDCEDTQTCYANFYTTFSDIPENNLEVNFVDASEVYEGEVTSWSWDFGDGETSDEQNPTHTYAAGGIYEVTLTIETSEGCTSSTILHICIGDGGGYEGPDCQAMFFFTQTDVEGFAFAFEDFSVGEAVAWSWDFGDGETSEEQNPAHTYAEGGLYLVTLSITTANGECTSTTVMPVFANEDAFYEDDCWALFIPFIDPESNTVFFLNLSSHETVETVWDFGDGTTSEEPFFAFHEYADGGTYTVTLAITTADGCESTFEATINIEEDEFTGNPQYSLINGTEEVNPVSKVNTYPNPVANTLNIEFNIAAAGTYTVNLTAMDGRTLQSVSGEATKGMNTTTINTTALPQGVYFVNIQSATATTSFKVVKE